MHDYVKELGLTYTIIDIGWWMQLYLPVPLRSAAPQYLKEISWSVYGTGDSKQLLTNLYNIGPWVARIITDPRTINKSVIIWEDEATLDEAWEIAEKTFGEEILKLKQVVSRRFLVLACKQAVRWRANTTNHTDPRRDLPAAPGRRARLHRPRCAVQRGPQLARVRELTVHPR